MKTLFAFCVLLSVLQNHSVAWAQEDISTVREDRSAVPEARTSKSKYYFGLFYSMATDVKFKGSAGPVAFEETDTSKPVPGLSIESVTDMGEGRRLSVGLSYDSSREFSEYRGNVAGVAVSGSYKSKPTLTILNSTVNFGFMTNASTEVYAGFGYAVPTLGNSSYSTSGSLGYQLGVALDTNEKYRVGAEYRVISCNVSGSSQGISISSNSCNLNGVNLVWKTSLN